MRTNIGRTFLTAYDACKQRRTAAECRDYVIKTMPAGVRTYLAAYDICLRSGMGVEKCRKLFSPPKEGTSPLTAIIIGGVIGFVVGRVL